jgi:hypothetical protein
VRMRSSSKSAGRGPGLGPAMDDGWIGDGTTATTMNGTMKWDDGVCGVWCVVAQCLMLLGSVHLLSLEAQYDGVCGVWCVVGSMPYAFGLCYLFSLCSLFSLFS